jgi:K+-sensing histidine kinase KdpD
LSHDLAVRSGVADVLATAVAHVQEVLGVRALMSVPTDDGAIEHLAGDRSVLESEADQQAVERTMRSGRPVGLSAGAVGPGVFHMPLDAGTGTRAVLSIRLHDDQVLEPERLELIRAFSSLIGLALERCRMADSARHTSGADRDRASAKRASQQCVARSAHPVDRDHRSGDDVAR